MPCGDTQDRRVMVERSEKKWSAGEGNGKPFQYSCLENPMNSMKRQNERILKEELPGRFSSVHYSLSIMSDSLRHHELQCASPLCPSPTPRVHSDSHPSCQWCHPAISSSVVPFSSCQQSHVSKCPYATGDQWRNTYRKTEGMEPKQTQYPVWMWLVKQERPDAVKSNIA